jgi:hypothetical protein
MRRQAFTVIVSVLAILGAFAFPAAADHTDPDTPLSPIQSAPQAGHATGAGTWEHVRHFPANPGSDLWFFEKNGATFASAGTLGQGEQAHVGQRIVQLLNADGQLDVQWVADHGSAACETRNPGGTLGLQHDVEVVPLAEPELLLDATDATGRCHDPAGGGIEIVDISGLGEENFEVRELHLVRFAGTTHTLTVDQERPWIVYSNNSDSSGRNWLDFVDLRTCLTEESGGTMPANLDLEGKRAHCQPEAHRIPFEDVWTQGTLTEDGEPSGASASCHDSTSVGTRLYCSGLNGEVILDVAGLVDENGTVRGTPLPCTTVPGTGTTAMVTDCSQAGASDKAFAEGWELLGFFNHPGRAQLNNNHHTPSDRGVSISHQSVPTPSEVGDYLIVSDERGGGVVPPGASCTPGIDNPYGNGGLHFLDISDPENIDYAKLAESGERAVWIGDVVVPAPSMCTVHVFHHLPDEQRLIMGYYSQGTKVLDYHVEEDGSLRFEEVASFVLPGTANWVTNFFKITDNPDGTRTYHLMSSDIARGIDVFTWTAEPNLIPTEEGEAGGPACERFDESHPGRGNGPPQCREGGEGGEGGQPPAGGARTSGNAALLLMSLAVLPTAAFVGRRRTER